MYCALPNQLRVRISIIYICIRAKFESKLIQLILGVICLIYTICVSAYIAAKHSDFAIFSDNFNVLRKSDNQRKTPIFQSQESKSSFARYMCVCPYVYFFCFSQVTSQPIASLRFSTPISLSFPSVVKKHLCVVVTSQFG